MALWTHAVDAAPDVTRVDGVVPADVVAADDLLVDVVLVGGLLEGFVLVEVVATGVVVTGDLVVAGVLGADDLVAAADVARPGGRSDAGSACAAVWVWPGWTTATMVTSVSIGSA